MWRLTFRKVRNVPNGCERVRQGGEMRAEARTFALSSGCEHGGWAVWAYAVPLLQAHHRSVKDEGGTGFQGVYLAWCSYPFSLGMQVGSRIVIVTAGCVLLLMGMFGKIGAAFATIPTPVIGGMFIVMFGVISAVGISNLQVRDLSDQQRHTS